MNNNFFKSFMCTLLFAIGSLIVAQEVAPVVDIVDNSGQERIAHIMSHVNHDVVPGQNEKIAYVQGCNLDQDLNLQEITNWFAPKTVMGKAHLHNVLKNPVSPTDQSGIVELRKNIIEELVNNPEFKQSVDNELDVSAGQEKVAMELLSNTFRGQTCGREFNQLETIKKDSPLLYPLFKFGTFNPTVRTLDFVKNSYFLYSVGYATKMLAQQAQEFKKANVTMPFEMFGIPMTLDYKWIATAAGVYGLFSCFFVYQMYRECSAAGQKRVKMHALNQLIHVAESIEGLAAKYNVATQFNMSLVTDSAGTSLINGLKAWRYENKTDYCFFVPGVHTFLYTVYECDAQLGQIFASIAEMDACNAIATKILESRSGNHKFCFAQKIDSNKPQLISQGFWNVLVPNAVINSMVMDHHVILTGPNAGGKTTSIRANLQNIVLAQTYGVAAAESFAYTPFDRILSYLNISDDLMNGLSLFASEIKRAKDLLEVIKSLQPGQKLFFALDELFTGTAAEQGEKCAYEFIKKTSEYNQTLFVYATHFNKLKELGSQNIGLTNYKVDAPIKNELGKLVYPFTLSPGASTINIAEDMAKEAGLFD